MTYLGKLIGLFLGYLVLGPIGAIIGLVIGATFDKGLRINLYQMPREHTAEVESAFFTATFSVMGHLAKADGRVSVDEIRAAEAVMQRLELNADLRQEAIRLFRKGKELQFDLQATLNQLYQQCSRQPELLRFFIEIQLEAALADGPLQAPEQSILLYMCKMLRISPMEFEQLWARQWASQSFHGWYSQFSEEATRQQSYRNTGYSSQRRGAEGNTRSRGTTTLKDAYGVLGVSENATPAEIKKAYRSLMNQHHPDKLVSRGLPESMLKLAKEKTQQISAAYEVVREAKGFR